MNLKYASFFFVTAVVLSTCFLNCGRFSSLSDGSQSSLSLNPGGGFGPTPSPAPAVPIPPVSLAVALPLYGCDNPYLGQKGNDWGTDLPNEDGPGPFPNGFVNPRTLTKTPPTYTSNTMFWTSRENGPGQSILMSGAFTTSSKKARMVQLTAGTTDWQSAVRSSTTLVDVTQMQSTGIAFKVPASFKAGVYAYRIEDSSGATPLEGIVNAPAMSWAQGVAGNIDYVETIRHKVYQCGAEVGQNLRIFGKNFTTNTGVFIQSPSNVSLSLTVMKQDENSLVVAVPNTIAAGSYKLWLGTSTADAISSPPYAVTFYPAQSPNIQNVTCSGLNGNGSFDNKNALQACLNNNKSVAVDANHLVMINIAAGNYLISGALDIPPYEYLNGASVTSTTITGSSSSAPQAWMTATHHFGLSNLKLAGPVSQGLLIVNQSGDEASSGTFSLNTVSFTITGDQSSGDAGTIKLSGPSAQLINSYIDSGNPKSSIDLEYSASSYITGNYIDAKGGYFSEGTSQNIIIENNKIYGAAGVHEQGGGPGLSLKFSEFDRSQINRNIYYSYNDFKDIAKWSVPGLTTDGGTIAYYGQVTNAQNDQMSLVYPISYRWVGNSNPQTLAVSIVAGRGVGQYRFIKSISGQNVQVDSPFVVQPDSSSVINISQVHHNVIIARNNFTNIRVESILLYGLGREFLIENNGGTNTGMGIGIAGYGPYQSMNYQSSFNIEVLSNKLSGEHGYYYAAQEDNNYAAGIYMQSFRGAPMSGVMVRGNSIQAPQSLQFTNGWENITSTIMEKNDSTYLQPSTSWVVPDSNSMPQLRLEGLNY